MHVGAVEPRERVIIIDDLVATGGTLSAAISLMGIYFSFFFLYSSIDNEIYLDLLCDIC